MTLRSAASAQTACTAAPAAPVQFKTAVERATSASGTRPFVPAVLTVSWKAPDTGRAPQNAPVQYVIEAGGTSGASDIATVQVVASDLEFVTPVADGSYFVRVRAANECGQSAPTREARVQIRNSAAPGSPNPIVILSTAEATRERLGTSAFVRVMGQVRNGWRAGPAALVTVTATYEYEGVGVGVTQQTFVNGSSGRLLRTGLMTDTVLEPGATGCFVMFAEFKTSRITGLGLVASASGAGSASPAGKVEVDGAPSLSKDEFDSVRASGRVRNTGNLPTRENEVWVEVRDSSGKVLDCAADPVTAPAVLPPNATADVVVQTEAPTSTARIVRWWPTWNEGDAVDTAPSMERYRALHAHLQELLAGDRNSVSPQELAAARDAVRTEATRLELSPAR